VLGSRVDAAIPGDDRAAAQHRFHQVGGECTGSPAEQPGGVREPGALVQVGFDLRGGDAAADRQGLGQDPPRAMPDRPAGVVDESLGAA
jgi:hypothetical protein